MAAKRKTRPSRLTRALLQTADDVRRSGLMDAGAHAKITMRHLGEAAATAPEKMTGDEVRAVRERAHLGQKDDD